MFKKFQSRIGFMNINRLFAILLLAILPFVSRCGGRPEPVKLEEIKTQKIPDVKNLPPLRGMVTEVELENGEQRYIYIKLGDANEWYKEGLLGFVFNDVAMTEKIAKFEIIEVYKNYSKGKILELNYVIKEKAVVEVEIDPRFLTK
ncbi:MAG: hypothetical protein FWG49_05175 [Leptospirales bacterium]|nr:hypothetical protein [Leptospirales bacterium]